MRATSFNLAIVLLVVVASPVRAQALNEVTIVGTDYAFSVPASLPPGPTAFTFENHGKVMHEMALVRLKPGATLDSIVHAGFGPENRLKRWGFMEISTGGLLFAEPGKRTDRLLVNLVPGQTYYLSCALRDAPDQPQHNTLGMLATFQVSSAAARQPRE